MMNIEEANQELRSVPKGKDHWLLITGPETLRRVRAEIPDWLPAGVYEFAWNVPTGDEANPFRIACSGKFAVEAAAEVQQNPDGVLPMMGDGNLPPAFAQMFALSQQIADIRAKAKDDFYQSTLTMMQNNNQILAEERKKMREEMQEERKTFLKEYKETMRVQSVTTIEPPDQDVMETVKEILGMPEVRPILGILAAKFAGGFAGEAAAKVVENVE